ncbi:MAG: hypothetical protein Kow00123_21260 [Anaerolineales bacterium]
MGQPAPTAKSDILTPQEAHAILMLRLLIARAAQRDSLAWWDDLALTAEAQFLLDPLFPVSPTVAARSLALRAAASRHRDAYEAMPHALHLYRLATDNRDWLVLRFMLPIHTPAPERPISSIAELRERLTELTSAPMPYTIVHRFNGLLQIQVPPPPPATSLLLHRARTFAWAYLEGEPGKPVFPYCVETTQ